MAGRRGFAVGEARCLNRGGWDISRRQCSMGRGWKVAADGVLTAHSSRWRFSRDVRVPRQCGAPLVTAWFWAVLVIPAPHSGGASGGIDEVTGFTAQHFFGKHRLD